MKKYNLFEIFAGIGSQYEAMKRISEVHPTGYVEWFVPAIISYEIIHHGKMKPDNKTSVEKMIEFLNSYNFSMSSKAPVSKGYWSRMNENKLRTIYPYLKRSVSKHGNQVDVTQVQILPKDIDILTYSFPCQDLSQQGNQKGISKGTRSGLLWEIERILLLNKNNLPKTLLLENVMALVSYKFLPDLNMWIKALEKLGYKSEWKVLNSSDFGSVQSRNRVFMVSTLNKNINWPSPVTKKKKLKSILDIDSSPILEKLCDYKLDGKRITKTGISKSMLINYSNFNSENYIYYPDGLGPTLTASGANSRIKIHDKSGIRYMTAREAYKYMGFKASQYDKVKSTNLVTDQKAIFTCGNSISVEVLMAIFEANK